MRACDFEDPKPEQHKPATTPAGRTIAALAVSAGLRASCQDQPTARRSVTRPVCRRDRPSISERDKAQVMIVSWAVGCRRTTATLT